MQCFHPIEKTSQVYMCISVYEVMCMLSYRTSSTIIGSIFYQQLNHICISIITCSMEWCMFILNKNNIDSHYESERCIFFCQQLQATIITNIHIHIIPHQKYLQYSPCGQVVLERHQYVHYSLPSLMVPSPKCIYKEHITSYCM